MLSQLRASVKYVVIFLYFGLSQAIKAYAYMQTYLLIIALRKDTCSKAKERIQPWPGDA